MRKHRFITLLVSLGYHAVLEIWRMVQRLFGWQVPGIAVVLYYHHVAKEHRMGFARQMKYLRRRTQPIRADHSSPLNAGTRYAVVTFDDGCLSVLENAVPELERLEIPATIFVIGKYLGRIPEWDPSERCITADELRKLGSFGLVELGSHSLTHPLMPSVTESQARMELLESRGVLGNILNRDIKLFCFPFSAYNGNLLRWCREAGYQRAFTGDPTLAFSDPHEFVTGRIWVEPTDSLLEFHLKLMGAYRWVPLVNRLKARLRAIRRAATITVPSST